MRDSLLYKADVLYVPEDSALRAELLRIYYNNLIVGYFGPIKTVAYLVRKYY
jgi:hypothetical protein